MLLLQASTYFCQSVQFASQDLLPFTANLQGYPRILCFLPLSIQSLVRLSELHLQFTLYFAYSDSALSI